jgi:hypothetical protein
MQENERGEPLDVGRKTRSIPPAIRRALNPRDGGCHDAALRAHTVRAHARHGSSHRASLRHACAA